MAKVITNKAADEAESVFCLITRFLYCITTLQNTCYFAISDWSMGKVHIYCYVYTLVAAAVLQQLL